MIAVTEIAIAVLTIGLLITTINLDKFIPRKGS